MNHNNSNLIVLLDLMNFDGFKWMKDTNIMFPSVRIYQYVFKIIS